MIRVLCGQLLQTLYLSFEKKNILLHIAAWVVMGVSVISGLDWWYYTVTRTELVWSIGIIAGPLGFIAPFCAPLVLWLYGKCRNNDAYTYAAYTLVYVQVAAWLISSGYKGVTGRAHPPLGPELMLPDMSAFFNFGFFREGVFWGWPSSHTAVAVAGATVLSRLFPSMQLPGFMYAIYIGFGAGTCFHWLSDALSGAFIGYATGNKASYIRTDSMVR